MIPCTQEVRIVRYAISILALAMAMSPALADDELESAFRGKRLAEANCAGCHALAQIDESTLEAAPPLRVIGARFSLPQLEEMLSGAVFLEHAEMPDFQPTAEQAHDLAAYIHSIASPR